MADYVDPTHGSPGGNPGPGWQGVDKRFGAHGQDAEYASPMDAAAVNSNHPELFTPQNPPLPGIKAGSYGATEGAQLPSGDFASKGKPDVAHGTGDSSKPPMRDPHSGERAPVANPVKG